MKKDSENLQKGSSIIIALVVVVLIIFVLYHYNITFTKIVDAVKGFFGM